MLKYRCIILFVLLLSSVWGAKKGNSYDDNVFFFFAPTEYKDEVEEMKENVLNELKNDYPNLSIEVTYSNKNNKDYGNEVGKILKGEDQSLKNKYDIVLFNVHHTHRFGKYLANLKKYLSVPTIFNYSTKDTLLKGPTNYVGYDGDNLVGLPFFIQFSSMYYNKRLLDKYGKGIPATWNDLFNTTKYIYEREISVNDELIGYIGDMPSSYDTIRTIQEAIYSYRDEVDSKEVPAYTSENAKEVLTLLKKLINNYSSAEACKSQETIKDKIASGNVLFAKTYNFKYDDSESLNFSSLPGKSVSYSSSSIKGYNVGIPISHDEERIKKISILINKMATSKVQAAVVKNHMNYSPLITLYCTFGSVCWNSSSFYSDQSGGNSSTNNGVVNYNQGGGEITPSSNYTSSSNDLYDQGYSEIDESIYSKEVCSVLDCDLINLLQFYQAPENSYDDKYDEFSEEFVQLTYEFIFGRTVNIDETLKKMDDLTRSYYIEYSSGLSVMVIIGICMIFVVMIASYIVMFHRKYNIYFVFLNNTYWGIFLYGTALILSYAIINLGDPDQGKCNLRFVFLTLGVPISFSPILLQLIVLYPETNKISNHVNRNFSNYLCCHILFELFLCTLYLFRPFEVTDHLLNISDGLENFRTCECKNTYTKVLVGFNIFEKGIEIVCFAILIFAEWNISATKTDIVSLTCAIVLDIFAFSLYAVFYFAEFKLKTTYYLTKVGPVVLFGLSNFIMIYLMKFTVMFSSKKEDIESKEAYVSRKTNTDILKNVAHMNMMNNNNNNSNSDNFINRIMKAHHETANTSMQPQQQDIFVGNSSAAPRVIVNTNNY